MENIIVVDENDNVIGHEPKEKCHLDNCLLHRGLSVFIFNDKNQLLIQKRSKFKNRWPLYWSGSCCGHPNANESYEQAAERTLEEELGISCKLKFLFKFQYKAKFKNMAENEICAVFIGRSNKTYSNNKEIADYKFIDINKLKADINKNPSKYTPWFKMELKEILSNHIEILNSKSYK